jgi:hypothetical protein
MAKKSKEIKNTCVYHDSLSNNETIFCYGDAAHNEVCLKYLKELQPINYGGLCTLISHKGEYKIIIGIKSQEDIPELSLLMIKANIVHELSHAVTYHMKYMGIEDDEYRSYLLQRLYLTFMSYLDSILYTKENLKDM